MFGLFIIESIVIQLLGTFWFISDPRTVKTRINFIIGKSFHAVYYPIIFILQYIVLKNFPKLLLPGVVVVQIIGVVVFILGVTLAIWAKITMRQSWGVPAQHDIKRQSTLIIEGPFRYTRNPIYMAIFLFGFGYFISLRSYLIFTMIIPLLYFKNAVYKEEKLLERYFIDDYKRYKKTVRRWL